MIFSDIYWIDEATGEPNAKPFCETGYIAGGSHRIFIDAKETIAAELDCDPDDLESNDDDQMCLHGKPVAIVKLRVVPTERPKPSDYVLPSQRGPEAA